MCIRDSLHMLTHNFRKHKEITLRCLGNFSAFAIADGVGQFAQYQSRFPVSYTHLDVYKRQIPNCAAAPSSRVRGLASSGPKSVIAPTPMKITSGAMPEPIATL